MLDRMFTVHFSNGSSTPYPDEVEYEFLPSGVLACTNAQHNAASYHAPGFWQSVTTDNNHKATGKGHPPSFKGPGLR